jgi:phosphate transport system ATP-binding protein
LSDPRPPITELSHSFTPSIRLVTGRSSEGPKNDTADAHTKLQVTDLVAGYRSAEVLKGITLPIDERQVTAVIGPSGCGKSTFIRCLNRMHEVTPGAFVG